MTRVQFYRCYDCKRIRLPDEISEGKDCGCGSWHVKYANPTVFGVLKLFIKYPKYFKILYEENIKPWFQ